MKSDEVKWIQIKLNEMKPNQDKCHLIVADIQSVKAYSLIDGSESWNYKNVFRISPHGANTSVSTFDDYVILSSWLDNHVKIMRPDTGEILESLDGLNIPVSATKYGDRIAVALQGDKSITLFKKYIHKLKFYL